MPEGPEIRRAADRIERALAGREVDEIHFAFPALQKYESRLRGRAVERIETRGKAMVTHVEGRLAIYSHNQLYGRWYVMKRGALPRTKRSLRLEIHNEEKSALLYSASEIEVLPKTKLDAHPFLTKLGPDALAPGLGPEDFIARVEEPRFARRPLHALLLDQGFVAGIGNYLRSEICFVAGLHPLRKPRELDPEEVRSLGRSIHDVTRRAYKTGGITNDPKTVRALKEKGWTRSAFRHQVFTRGGQPCHACGDEIRRSDLGGRQLYFCPSCQPLAAD